MLPFLLSFQPRVCLPAKLPPGRLASIRTSPVALSTRTCAPLVRGSSSENAGVPGITNSPLRENESLPTFVSRLIAAKTILGFGLVATSWPQGLPTTKGDSDDTVPQTN